MSLKTVAFGLALTLIGATASQAEECTLTGDAQAGRFAASMCRACHIFDVSKPSRSIGPNIHSVFGEKAASRSDFEYSEGMRGAAAKGLVWTEDNLFEYLADPKAFLDKINGQSVKHKMAFFLKNEIRRRQVIAYLKAIKNNPDCK